MRNQRHPMSVSKSGGSSCSVCGQARCVCKGATGPTGFGATGPTGPCCTGPTGASAADVQSFFGSLVSDVQTTSATFATLFNLGPFPVPATPNPSIEVHVSFAATAVPPDPGGEVEGSIRLAIDGTPIQPPTGATGTGIGPTEDVLHEGGAIVWRQFVTPGAHTVNLQWNVTGGTLRLFAATDPSHNHLNVLVRVIP